MVLKRHQVQESYVALNEESPRDFCGAMDTTTFATASQIQN